MTHLIIQDQFWYHSEPSDVPLFSKPVFWFVLFCRFLQQDGSMFPQFNIFWIYKCSANKQYTWAISIWYQKRQNKINIFFANLWGREIEKLCREQFKNHNRCWLRSSLCHNCVAWKFVWKKLINRLLDCQIIDDQQTKWE